MKRIVKRKNREEIKEPEPEVVDSRAAGRKMQVINPTEETSLSNQKARNRPGARNNPRLRSLQVADSHSKTDLSREINHNKTGLSSHLNRVNPKHLNHRSNKSLTSSKDQDLSNSHKINHKVRPEARIRNRREDQDPTGQTDPTGHTRKGTGLPVRMVRL